MIFIDLNPELVSLSFLQIGVSGFGLEIGYERIVAGGFSLLGDIKTVQLSMSDTRFSVWDISISGRYYLFKKKIFTNMRLGTLLYQSPYYEGWMLNIGIDVGWKFTIKSHLILEPYFGCNVYSDDKFIMPFTVTSLSEFVIPGFITGMRIGLGF
jgi:hypothetical protein